MSTLRILLLPGLLWLAGCQPFKAQQPSHNSLGGWELGRGEEPGENFLEPKFSVNSTDTQIRLVVEGVPLEFVDFYLDENTTAIHSATSAPYELVLPYADLTPGAHQIRVVAGVRLLGKVSSLVRYENFEVPSSVATQPKMGCEGVGSNEFMGCYYRGLNFDELVFTRTDESINFNYGQGSPDARLPVDGFSIRWRGRFDFAQGEYQFTVRADDGVRLYVDGTRVVDQWQNQPATTFTARRTLNGTHLIELEYYESHASAEVSLVWARAGQDVTPAPSAPRSLQASAQGTSQVNLTWQPPTNAAQAGVQNYRIYRNNAVAATVSGTQTTYNNTGLQAGTTYSYQVVAIGTAGESSKSTAVSATTEAASNVTVGARPVPRSRDARASDIFVSPSGGGTTCSQSNPCSLTTGINRGDFVWMLSGTYRPGNTTIRLSSGQTLEAYQPKQAIIDFQNTDGRVTFNGDRAVLRNVVVRNSSASGGGIRIFGNYNLIEGVISEGHYGSGVGIHAGNYNNLTDPRNGNGQMAASYNKMVDSIFRRNSDSCAKGSNPSSCSDSDADGISISSGRGNEIIHCEADFNADDGYDIWRSYESRIVNSVATNNGRSLSNPSVQVGNGKGFKMGSRTGPQPNRHVLTGNLSYDNRSDDYTCNGGEGYLNVSGNFCGRDGRPCSTSNYAYCPGGI